MKKIINKIFKENKTNIEFKGDVTSIFIYGNPYIQLIHDACSICYDRNKDTTLDKMLEYDLRRAKSGHESILEHSNIIIGIVCDVKLNNELSEVLSLCRYLDVQLKEHNEKMYVLIGGSIRGYKHIVRRINNPFNKVFKSLLDCMYNIHSTFLYDFIDDGIMIKENFYDDLIEINFEPIKEVDLAGSTVCNIDNIRYIYEEKLPYEFKYIFSIEDLIKLSSITIRFNDVPRIISQQMTRHRAGITQLSQRYVNQEHMKFISPEICKPERYDMDKTYNIKLLDSETSVTLSELGDILISIYPQLIKQGLLKEDARAFLPSNIETSLYMTFSHINFIHFLEVRCDSHAQADIRARALKLNDYLKYRYEEMNLNTDIFKYLNPIYKNDNEESINIDETL